MYVSMITSPYGSLTVGTLIAADNPFEQAVACSVINGLSRQERERERKLTKETCIQNLDEVADLMST